MCRVLTWLCLGASVSLSTVSSARIAFIIKWLYFWPSQCFTGSPFRWWIVSNDAQKTHPLFRVRSTSNVCFERMRMSIEQSYMNEQKALKVKTCFAISVYTHDAARSLRRHTQHTLITQSYQIQQQRFDAIRAKGKAYVKQTHIWVPGCVSLSLTLARPIAVCLCIYYYYYSRCFVCVCAANAIEIYRS